MKVLLAQEVIAVDALDTNLQKAKLYREALASKDLEQTAYVLHALHPDVIRALIDGDWKALVGTVDELPQQLEELTEDAVTYMKERRRERRPVIYMHVHIDEDGNPPTVAQYYRIAQVVQRYLNYATAINAKRGVSANDKAIAQQVERAFLAPPTDEGTRVKYEPIGTLRVARSSPSSRL